MLAQTLRTPRERTRFAIAVAVSAVVWLVMCVSIAGIFYAAAIGLFVLFAHALFLAHITGYGIRVGPGQLPDIHARIEAAAKKLGLDRAPEAYVINAGGVLNAFATKLLSRRFLIIYSDLLDACETAAELAVPGQPTELDFVLAHEIGHHACGHLKWNGFLLPARMIPWLGPAYSRACEYTSDACGHAVVGDLETSARALALLASGGRSARRVNLQALAAQRFDTGRFWMAVYELNSSHPYLSKRIAELEQLGRPRSAPAVARNPLAYPLAPLFAFAGGGGAAAAGLAMVAMIGIIAAIAVPNFLNATQRGKQKRVMSDLRLLGTGIESYQVDFGHPPAAGSIAELAPFLMPTYVKQLPRMDSWNHPYVYETWSTEESSSGPDSYVIICHGKDGEPDVANMADYPTGSTQRFNADIVFANGSFQRWPEGSQD